MRAVYELRARVAELETLLHASTNLSTSLATALRDEAAAADAADETAAEWAPASCPPSCIANGGNCNAITGECVCGLTRTGSACELAKMPACSLGSAADEVINLSYLVSEEFWDRMRDLRVGDARRVEPEYRWLGFVPCACVEQAVATFSLANAPEQAPWPTRIGQLEVAMVRALCVVEPRRTTVGQLWRGGASGLVDWSYVPVFGWMKPFPTHGPILLPPGMVSEELWTKPVGGMLQLMRHGGNPATTRPRVRLADALRLEARLLPKLLPAAACGAAACSGAGWCGSWGSEKRNSCNCAREWSSQSLELRKLANRARTGGAPANTPPPLRRQPSSSHCATEQVGWQDEMARPQVETIRPWQRPLEGLHDRWGAERWRSSLRTLTHIKGCPNECLGRGVCTHGGFCRCREGSWGLDCGMDASRARELARAPPDSLPRPRIHVYEVPVSLRRTCGPWRFPEDLSDSVLASPHYEPRAEHADLFWLYGCPNGDMVLPALQWIKRTRPWWNTSVARGEPRHVIVSPQEEGLAEMWRYLGAWLGGYSDHANMHHTWDDLHPASPTRQLVMLQLSGASDYVSESVAPPRRGVSAGARCRVCFQPGKDVMIPGFPGIMDYPSPADGRNGHPSQCSKLRALTTGGVGVRTRQPVFFFAGAMQTKTHGPGLYEASRLVPYLCWKNRSDSNKFRIVQTEVELVSVRAWEVERPVDANEYMRQAQACAVPEGKIGSYGHRSIASVMLGCVPVVTKELFSHNFFDEVIDWKSLSLHVPPREMPRLPGLLRAAPLEGMRDAAQRMRRRLLWTRLYGACHLAQGEGGPRDAFDTLMEVLRLKRRHFVRSAEHAAGRAPELLKELYAWLRQHDGEQCTRSEQCFADHGKSLYSCPN